MGLILGNLRICLLSGGNWNNGSNAGLWNLNWNNNRTNSNNNVSFRSDYASPSKHRGAKWSTGIGYPGLAEINRLPLFGRGNLKTRGNQP